MGSLALKVRTARADDDFEIWIVNAIQYTDWIYNFKLIVLI